MNAQELIKSLYKGFAIQCDLKIVGIKPFVGEIVTVGCYDCLNCDDDCACTF